MSDPSIPPVLTDSAAPPSRATPPADDSSDWRSGIPEDIRSSETLKDIKSVADLAKGYVHAQRSIGNNVAIPSKDAKPEEWDAFFKRVGRPDAADKYELVTSGHENLGIPEQRLADFRNEAHRLGLSQRQAAGLYEWFAKSGADDMRAFEASREQAHGQAIAALKGEWGQAFDQNIEMARQGLREFGGDELVQLMNDSGLGDDPRMVKAFYSIGRALSEDKLHGRGGDLRGAFKFTPGEARDQINQKMGDSEFTKAYINADHPGHAAAVQEMQRLHQAASAVG